MVLGGGEVSLSSYRQSLKKLKQRAHRVTTQVAQSMDFRSNVKLTSDPNDYDPEHLLRKLRKNHIDHMSFDATLYRKTKKRVGDLIKICEKTSASTQREKALSHLKNLKQFEERLPERETLQEKDRRAKQKMTASQPNLREGCEDLSLKDMVSTFGRRVSNMNKEDTEGLARKIRGELVSFYERKVTTKQQRDKMGVEGEPDYIKNFKATEQEDCADLLQAVIGGHYDFDKEDMDLQRIHQCIANQRTD